MSHLFHPDTPIMKALSFLFDLIQASVLFLLCSLPLVTLGAAAAGLSSAMISLRETGSAGPGDFFRGFRSVWKQATLLWLALAIFGGFLRFNLRLLPQLDSRIRFPLLLATLFLLFCWVILVLSLFPLLGTAPALPLPGILTRALYLGILKLPKTLLLLLLALLPGVLFLLRPALSLSLGILWAFFWPALLMYQAVRFYQLAAPPAESGSE